MTTKICRNTDSSGDRHGKPVCGVYCQRCMRAMRLSAKARRTAESLARAVEAGAGDLWRLTGGV